MKSDMVISPYLLSHLRDHKSKVLNLYPSSEIRHIRHLQKFTILETNIARENLWLENYFPFGISRIFVSFRESKC